MRKDYKTLLIVMSLIIANRIIAVPEWKLAPTPPTSKAPNSTNTTSWRSAMPAPSYGKDYARLFISDMPETIVATVEKEGILYQDISQGVGAINYNVFLLHPNGDSVNKILIGLALENLSQNNSITVTGKYWYCNSLASADYFNAAVQAAYGAVLEPGVVDSPTDWYQPMISAPSESISVPHGEMALISGPFTLNHATYFKQYGVDHLQPNYFFAQYMFRVSTSSSTPIRCRLASVWALPKSGIANDKRLLSLFKSQTAPANVPVNQHQRGCWNASKVIIYSDPTGLDVGKLQKPGDALYCKLCGDIMATDVIDNSLTSYDSNHSRTNTGMYGVWTEIHLYLNNSSEDRTVGIYLRTGGGNYYGALNNGTEIKGLRMNGTSPIFSQRLAHPTVPKNIGVGSSAPVEYVFWLMTGSDSSLPLNIAVVWE